MGGVDDARQRSLVLVVGSGRSGTSTLSGILKRLGFHVPQPEIPADDSNPRGFAESKWVVDFHAQIQKTARITNSDARPSAWADAAEAANTVAAAKLKLFLRRQYLAHDNVLIKDPRLIWSLPMWRRCAIELGITPRYVTMLRHPAAVVQSKGRHYGAWPGDASRTAGWINTQLYAERATRDGMRAFLRYEDLLGDWPRALARLADVLQLDAIASASSASIREADTFIDRSLARSGSTWSDLELPEELRARAEAVWGLLDQMANDGGMGSAPDTSLLGRLDVARAEYIDYYRSCEAVADSSILAAVKGGQARSSASFERMATRLVPDRYRRRVPIRWRKAMLSVMGQSGRR